MMCRYFVFSLALFCTLIQARLSETNDRDQEPDPSMCGRIPPEDLPEECTCQDKPPYGFVVDCLKTFNSTYFNDTIGMYVDVDICNPEGSRVSVDVTEADYDIDFPIAGITAGEEKEIPIPGMAIIVPGVGHLGVDVAILIAGNPDTILLKVGLNACIALAQRTVCASSVPGLDTVLPWWILSGTYHFGDLCDQNITSAAARTAATIAEETALE